MLAAVPGIAAVAFVALFIGARLGPTSSTAQLLATWTPTPTLVTGSAAQSAYAACQTELNNVQGPMVVTAMTGVLAEQRGDLTGVLLSSGSQVGLCLLVQGEASGIPAVFSGVDSLTTSPQSGVELDDVPGQLNGSGAFRIAYGQSASNVASVTVLTYDGQTVQSTVAGGLFFAWWPTGSDPETITSETAQGTGIQVLTLPGSAAPTPPPPTREP
jgi:hypothetical protein